MWSVWPVLCLVSVNTQSKLYDRYALPVWVAAAVGGVAIEDAELVEVFRIDGVAYAELWYSDPTD